jgi:hypothetical protein
MGRIELKMHEAKCRRVCSNNFYQDNFGVATNSVCRCWKKISERGETEVFEKEVFAIQRRRLTVPKKEAH